MLLDAERAFLQHAFKLGDNGKLLYPGAALFVPEEVGQDDVRRAS